MFLPDAKNIGLTNSVSTNHRITAPPPPPPFQVQIVRSKDRSLCAAGVGSYQNDFFKFIASLSRNWFVSSVFWSVFSLVLLIRKAHTYYIHIVPQCLSPRPNWNPISRQRGAQFSFRYKVSIIPVLWIRIGFKADSKQAFLVNPDPGFWWPKI
jgi:hypothetical protein